MKHILIVEDDTTFAVMLQTWLSKKKFSVASVSGIAAAKKTLIESSVDLVLCDLRLPDGDGIDRNDELRGYPVGCSGDETRCERLYI